MKATQNTFAHKISAKLTPAQRFQLISTNDILFRISCVDEGEVIFGSGKQMLWPLSKEMVRQTPRYIILQFI